MRGSEGKKEEGINETTNRTTHEQTNKWTEEVRNGLCDAGREVFERLFE
jgi:hypothetical protein